MKEILLTKNSVCLVDDEDYSALAKYKWQKHSGGYAVRSHWITGGKGKTNQVYMHRAIMGVIDAKKQVDHINGNKLDNRKVNLRICTESQNKRNSSKRAHLEYKGVYFVPKLGKFKASITFDRKTHHLGVFMSQKVAAQAYDKAAKKYFGEFAKLNFI